MKQRLIFIVMFLSFSALSWAQQTYPQQTYPQQTTKVPETSRYEIVQSESFYGTQITLKLDKYTGYVYHLLKNREGLTWQLMSAEMHPLNEITANQVNFQILFSASGALWTFLINVNTGITWRLLKYPKIGYIWSVVE